MGLENKRLPRSIPFRSLQTADEGNRLSRPGGKTPRYPVYDSQLEYDNRGRQGSGRRLTGASSSSILWRSRERWTGTKVRIPEFPAIWHCVLRQPRRAASMVATSIFFIGIIARSQETPGFAP